MQPLGHATRGAAHGPDRVALMPRPSVLQPPWNLLAASVGGVEALASKLDVHRNTITRWGSGVVPESIHTRRAVNLFARRRGLPEPWPEK